MWCFYFPTKALFYLPIFFHFLVVGVVGRGTYLKNISITEGAIQGNAVCLKKQISDSSGRVCKHLLGFLMTEILFFTARFVGKCIYD